MIFLIIISSYIIANSADTAPEDVCDGYVIKGVYHEKDTLITDIARPFMLDTDYKSNTLYFSYTVNDNDDEFQSGKINLNTKEFATIAVPNGFGHAVDQNTQEVYIGTREGLYKYNPKTEKTDFLGAKDFDIWSVHVKDDIYFITFPAEFVYKLINGESVRSREFEEFKANALVINDDDTFVFANVSGIYHMTVNRTSWESNVVQLSDDGFVRDLSSDKNGDIYAVYTNGTISQVKSDHLEDIGDIDEAYSVTFDNENNMIVSTNDSLLRLVPNSDKTDACA